MNILCEPKAGGGEKEMEGEKGYKQLFLKELVLEGALSLYLHPIDSNFVPGSHLIARKECAT